MPYRTLNPERIIETAERLAERIDDRFPQAGLAKVGGELVKLARDINADIDTIDRPIIWLRATIGMIVLAGSAAFLWLVAAVLPGPGDVFAKQDIIPVVEAGINIAVLLGAGLFALVAIEERLKRKRAFGGLHGIRSLIHVIDMHQLTKDPITLTADYTSSGKSPRRVLGKAEMLRYLDYCSEMIAVTGKLAALYAQALNDVFVVEAVNDIENLGSNLSRKVWQKIALISGGRTKDRA